MFKVENLAEGLFVPVKVAALTKCSDIVAMDDDRNTTSWMLKSARVRPSSLDTHVNETLPGCLLPAHTGIARAIDATDLFAQKICREPQLLWRRRVHVALSPAVEVSLCFRSTKEIWRGSLSRARSLE